MTVLTLLAVAVLNTPASALAQPGADTDLSLARIDAEIRSILAQSPRDEAVLDRLRRAEKGLIGLRDANTAQDRSLRVDQLLSPKEVRALPDVAATRVEGVDAVPQGFESLADESKLERLRDLVRLRGAKIERVYGPDDRGYLGSNGDITRPPGIARRPTAVTPPKDLLAKCARATVLLVREEALTTRSDGMYVLHGLATFRSRHPGVRFCDDAPLLDSFVVPVNCATGFLTGPRQVVTARHVVRGDHKVGHESALVAVFDYTDENVDKQRGEMVIPPERVARFNGPTRVSPADHDWCILTLAADAPPWQDQTRQPLVATDAPVIPVGTVVFTVGFPNGSVMTLADDGQIKRDLAGAFSATLDIFGGNSGGAVVGLDGKVYGVVSSAPNGTWATYQGSSMGELGFGTSADCRAPKRASADGEHGDTCASILPFRAYLAHW